MIVLTKLTRLSTVDNRLGACPVELRVIHAGDITMNTDKWQTTAPTEAGLWLHKCAETDNHITPIIIGKSKHGLMAHCKDLGATLLVDYHNGLTRSEWRKAT